jgi:hypothetical protein
MGATFVLLAYVELLSGGANLPGGPFGEVSGAANVVLNPNWIVLRIYIYHCLLLSILMAITLIDQDRQRVPWSIVIFALLVVAYISWSWRHLYFERTRTIRIPEVKAQFDALFGALWGASPWIIAMAALRLRGKQAAITSLRSLAMAAAVVGSFLGVRAIVRIAAMWLIGWLLTRLWRPASGVRLSPLIPLWLATLAHIVFWKRLAETLSW